MGKFATSDSFLRGHPLRGAPPAPGLRGSRPRRGAAAYLRG